jgi:ABC-type transport system involved in multi-copper enzyme maturation permease subunit
MFGPVLRLELLNGVRRSRMHWLRAAYAGWLVLLTLIHVRSGLNPSHNDLIGTLLTQHLALILLATPVCLAGAVTELKERGTLDQLLASQLTEAEILLGKALGRGFQVVALALPVLPLLAVTAGLDGVSPLNVLIPGLASLGVLGALTGGSVLASVWSRTTRGAALAVYALAVAGVLVAWGVGRATGYPVGRALVPAAHDTPLELWGPMLAWLLGGLAVGGFGLAVAVWRLRPAFARQLVRVDRQRRWGWSWRPKMPDQDVIAWKERFVDGAAPHALGRWLSPEVGLLLTVGLAGASFTTFWQLGSASARYARVAEATTLHGLTALVIGTLLVGVRCSGAISGERERGTWDLLRTTPLTPRELVRGKFAGVTRATALYGLAYAGITCAFIAVQGDMRAYLLFVFELALGVFVPVLGAVGLWRSARSRRTWRSLLTTLGFGYGTVALVGTVGGFLLAVFAVVLGMILASEPGTILALILFLGAFVGLFVCVYEHFLNVAEREVEAEPNADNRALMREAGYAIYEVLIDELGAPPVWSVTCFGMGHGLRATDPSLMRAWAMVCEKAVAEGIIGPEEPARGAGEGG